VATNILPEWRKWLSKPQHFLALGLGSGLSPKAPGTVGTLCAIPLYYLFCTTPLWVQLSIVFTTGLLGIYLCGYTAKALGVHDHPAIVWDEFVGYWLTMLAVPLAGYESPHWSHIVIGFMLFRLFDITKPWPISWADRYLSGGIGIMLDDILAGIYSAALLCIGLYFSY